MLCLKLGLFIAEKYIRIHNNTKPKSYRSNSLYLKIIEIEATTMTPTLSIFKPPSIDIACKITILDARIVYGNNSFNEWTLNRIFCNIIKLFI